MDGVMHWSCSCEQEKKRKKERYDSYRRLLALSRPGYASHGSHLALGQEDDSVRLRPYLSDTSLTMDPSVPIRLKALLLDFTYFRTSVLDVL